MFCIHGPMDNLSNQACSYTSVYIECNAGQITFFALIVKFFHFHKGVFLIMLGFLTNFKPITNFSQSQEAD